MDAETNSYQTFDCQTLKVRPLCGICAMRHNCRGWIAPFGVGELLTMNSPHTGIPVHVSYRGKIGSDATVILGGYQITVPFAWLSR